MMFNRASHGNGVNVIIPGLPESHSNLPELAVSKHARH